VHTKAVCDNRPDLTTTFSGACAQWLLVSLSVFKNELLYVKCTHARERPSTFCYSASTDCTASPT
jgi:hypothetical protein